MVGAEIKGPAVAATAGVGCGGAILGKRGDGGKIGAARGAENGCRVVIRLFGIVFGAQFFGRFIGVLGLEGIQNFKNIVAAAQSFQNILGISPGTVKVGLVTAIQLNAEFFHGFQKLGLKMLGKVFVRSPRVGDIHVGAADIFVVGVAHHFAHIRGDLAAAVVFVPGEQKARLFPLFLQGANDEIGGDHVAEVSDVDRAGRADARGANVLFFLGVAVNQPLCNFF